MKISTLLLTILLVGQFAFGQTPKTYSGNFNSKNFKGTSTYSYYEEGEQRIFSGPFSFKSSTGNVSIVGNYKQSLKNGNWKIVLTNVLNSDLFFKSTITANVSGSFLNGNLNGQWSLDRTKLISFANNGISNYYQQQLNGLSYLFDGKTVDFNKTTKVSETSKANFKDNHFDGQFTHSVNNGKSTISGQFDENGYLNGIWTVNYYSEGILHFLTKTYQNGVLLTTKEKDNSTGVTKTLYDQSFETTEFFQNYNKEENSSLINGKYYKLVDGNSSNNNDKFLNDALSIWYNSSSLSNSSYNFEIEIGTNKLLVYPVKKIEYDEAKTEKYEEELEQKKEEQEQLEETKKQQEEELKREKQRIQREFEYSDYGSLQTSVKKEFQAWLLKSDFETATDFEARIKTQAESKYTTILNQKVDDAFKRKMGRFSFATIGEYNADSETYSLMWGKTDTVNIKVSKQIAKEFYSAFKNKEQYGQTEIYIYPTKLVMTNNNWKVVDAIIVFNNYWYGTSSGKLEAVKVYKKNETFFYDRETNNYNTMSKENKPYQMTDFNSVQNSATLPREVFYLELHLNPTTTEQNLKFNYTDLQISLPKF